MIVTPHGKQNCRLVTMLTDLDHASRLSLLAYCVSTGIDALYEKVNRYGAGISANGLTLRMAQAGIAVQVVDLDKFEAGWGPTVDTYLNRVPKARILEAVREAKGEGTAQLLDHLKKGEITTAAERLLKGRSWLSEVLRRGDLVTLDSAEGQGVDAAAEVLRASVILTFLSSFQTIRLSIRHRCRPPRDVNQPGAGIPAPNHHIMY